MILLDEEYGDLLNESDSEPIQAPLDEIVFEPEVRRHALTNASNLWIFCLATTYREHFIEVLIDRGSHNNFIQEGLVDKLGLQCVPAQRFLVYIGNGQFLLCDRMCVSIPLVLQGHEFLVDLYVLSICGLDIVLGMQWLWMLGPYIRNHEALTMEFTWKGKRGCLSGNLVTKPRQVTYNQFCALLHSEFVNFYTLQVVDARAPTI